jgi:CBS domain-containing protein
VQTAEIGYRVADFLKQHPPFTTIDDADLLALAEGGRVRFHEPSDYILWQGEPHRHQVFVIQQGSVSLWDETGGRSVLRDVRGEGDLLGIERYHDAPRCMHTVRAESEVVIYAFAADDFDALIAKYPHAAQHVAADGGVTAEYQGASARRAPHRTFLHSLVGRKPLVTCRITDSLADVASRLIDSRADVVAVLDEREQLRGVVCGDLLLRWTAAGGGDARGLSIGALVPEAPVVVSPNTSVSDGALAMGGSSANALALTTDGTITGDLQAIITPSDLAPLFGDRPADLLRDIRRSGTLAELGELNQRARALTLEYLTSASAVDWLSALTHAVDVAMVSRILGLNGVVQPQECWCFAGTAGRAETLTKLAPQIVVVAGESADVQRTREVRRRVLDSLAECDYLSSDPAFEPDFYVASASEWTDRYRRWLVDPIREQTYRALALFDLRPVLGPRALWQDVESTVTGATNRVVLHVLANDCLENLPPLTFYQDAVIDQAGEHLSTFNLEDTVLRPLVDVGRVFGLAGRAALGRSTLDRFETARTLLPAHERIFREAAAAVRVVLWQQGRVGILQGTTGGTLPPTLLSRQDRHVLKSGFRSILDLLEFTAERTWLETL